MLNKAKMKKIVNNTQSNEDATQTQSSGQKRKSQPQESSCKKKSSCNNENSDMSVSNCCHQCKRNNRGKVVHCLKCKRRRYCVPCITNWYPLMSEKDFEQACPVCISNCNCIYCLRSKVPTGDAASLKSSEGDFSRYASYMLKMILPFMRHICEEQEKEKMLEAETHGLLSLSRLKIEAAESELDKHMYCDNCKAYILDLHRSCTHCSYKICLTCSREVCEGCLQGVEEDEIMQLIDPGEEYLHGVGKYNVSSEKGGPLENPNGSRGEDFVKSTCEWRLDKDGSIPCPPKSMNGCGEGMLKLKHILGENQLSSLLWRANALSENHLLKDMFETSEKGCTCANSCDMDTSGGNLRKAASRENSDDKGSDAECMPCSSNEGENCCQGPSAMEAAALTEEGGKEGHPSYGTTMSNIASEKELEVVPHSTSSATSMRSASAVCASPSISHLTPRSLPTKTVGFFKELADMLQGDKFDQVLPPQVQLDEQIISDYQLVLKIGMSRDLRELCKDSRYLEFIEVLTGLLACRRIPSNLHQGFLSLRHDLPALATRVLELNMKVRHGMTQKLNRCVMKELTGCMDRYHACEHKLLKLEQEKESETGRQNDSIDSEISRLTAEAEELLKACAAKSHKLSSLDVGDGRHHSDYERSLEELIKLENEWRQRVSTLKF